MLQNGSCLPKRSNYEYFVKKSGEKWRTATEPIKDFTLLGRRTVKPGKQHESMESKGKLVKAEKKDRETRLLQNIKPWVQV